MNTAISTTSSELDKQEAYLTFLQEEGSHAVALAKADITPGTYRMWSSRYPSFRRRANYRLGKISKERKEVRMEAAKKAIEQHADATAIAQAANVTPKTLESWFTMDPEFCASFVKKYLTVWGDLINETIEQNLFSELRESVQANQEKRRAAIPKVTMWLFNQIHPYGSTADDNRNKEADRNLRKHLANQVEEYLDKNRQQQMLSSEAEWQKQAGFIPAADTPLIEHDHD